MAYDNWPNSHRSNHHHNNNGIPLRPIHNIPRTVGPHGVLQLTEYGPNPIDIICPHCQDNITTLIIKEHDKQKLLFWLIGIPWCTLCLLAYVIGIPCCGEDLKKVTHVCPNCGKTLGVHNGGICLCCM